MIHWQEPIGRQWLAGLGILGVAGLGAVALGPDDNWDLLYYHLYAPFAYLHQRYLYDLGPAQSQGYFNPTADLLFYGMISSHLNDFPRIVAFIMGAVHGINAALVFAIACEVLRPQTAKARWALRIIALLIGVTGAGFVSLLGTTTNDLINSIFVLASLLIILRVNREQRPHQAGRGCALAGLLFGLGVGLKYTAAIFAPGLAFATLAVAARRRSLAAPFAFGAAAVLGCLAVAGHHLLALWRDFGNPIFPFLNDLFRSPYAEPQSLRDMRFVPHDLMQAIASPFRWMVINQYLVMEAHFRDWRGAVASLAAVATVLARMAQPLRGRAGASETPGLGLLVGFAAVSFFAWEFAFSIYRYAVVLEMLSGVVIIGALTRVVVQPRLRLGLAVTLAVIIAATTVHPDWGRREWSERYVDVEVPPLPPHSIVLIATWDPAAYFIPFADPSARYLGIENNFLTLAQTNRMASEVKHLMQTPGPSKFIVNVGPFDPGKLNSVLDPLGLRLAAEPCMPIESNLAEDAGEQLSLCRIAD
jgi:hypothetical protein